MSKVEIFAGNQKNQRAVQIYLVRHTVDYFGECLGDGIPIRAIFEHKGTCKLSFQFLEMIVARVFHFIANSDQHKLNFVELTDLGLGFFRGLELSRNKEWVGVRNMISKGGLKRIYIPIFAQFVSF